MVQKKSLPLHPLSERKPLKKSSLKDLDINKQVVQKAYLGKQTETVNNLNKLRIDLVLEQIKRTSIVHNDIFTMKSLILAQDER